MEPVSIAAMSLPILKKLFETGAEEFAKSSGKGLWDLIKSTLSKHHKDEVVKQVETGNDRQVALEEAMSLLTVLLQTDLGKKTEIEKCLQLFSAGLNQTVSGSNHITIGSSISSSINIQQR